MKARISNYRRAALTLVELLVVVAALALLVVLVLRPLYRAKAHSAAINCKFNLKNIELAFSIWAGDHAGHYPMGASVTNGGTMEWVAGGQTWPHFVVMSNELNTPKNLLCPADTKRSVVTNWNDLRNGNTSYFVGVDANTNRPAMLLSGDRQVTCDGSLLAPGLHQFDTQRRYGWLAQIHRGQAGRGNIALADGSVQAVDGKGLRLLLLNSGVATNRLALP